VRDLQLDVIPIRFDERSLPLACAGQENVRLLQSSGGGGGGGGDDAAAAAAAAAAEDADESNEARDDAWVPAALEVQHVGDRQQPQQDIISMLVSIYGSKEMFVSEYRSMLAERLLALSDFATEKEARARWFRYGAVVMCLLTPVAGRSVCWSC
jgi:hypothetical protein